MRQQSLKRHAILTVLTILAAGPGCGGLPGDEEPAQLFMLTPKNTHSPDLPNVDWQSTVDIPVAEAGLNNARIALRQTPVSLEYFARANWIDTAPVIVQSLLVKSFENTGKIVAVGRQSVSLRADSSLIPELRGFQTEYKGAGPPKVRVRINAKLVKIPQRSITATMTAEHVEPAKDTDLPAIVNAFDISLGKTIKRIVDWTLRTPPPSKN